MVNGTILVVDDDLAIRESLADVLADEGFRVALAEDGLAGLAYLRRESAPDVILLDWMMPRCDGATFRREQLKDPHIAGIPVILLSADGRLDQKMKDVGAISCLKKPVDLDALLDTVEKYARSA